MSEQDKTQENEPQVTEEKPELTDDQQFAADFPEMAGVQVAEPEEKIAEEKQEAAEEKTEERTYDDYDAKLDDLVKQNQAQTPDMPVQSKKIEFEVDTLPEDTDDEITNEINRAVNRQVLANKQKQEQILNSKLAEMDQKISRFEQVANKVQTQERSDAESKFKDILKQQGHNPDAYLGRLQKYVNSLPKDQVEMVYNTAKGVKSALIFQTMFEADMGNYQKLSAEDVSRAREQGERAATERLRANPTTSGVGNDSQKQKSIWDMNDKEWAEARDQISDEEAFGI